MDEDMMLVSQASKGIEPAFGELVKKYQGMVYRLCFSKLKNREDALDVSQEVFIKMWKSLPAFRGDSSLTTWLYRVTQNAVSDRLRSRMRTPDTVSTDIHADGDGDGEQAAVPVTRDEGDNPESALEKKERIRAVRRAMEMLSPEHREAVLLRDIEGYTYAQIAEMLGVGEGTVKSRISRARIRLKEILQNGNFL